MNRITQKVYEAEGETQTTLALGFVRYEFVRMLKPHEFDAIWRRSLKPGNRFDDIIDEMIEKEAK